jgi:hypothetical protein
MQVLNPGTVRVMAITKCRIWLWEVNRFTARRDVLRQRGHISDGWSALLGWRRS